MSGSDAKVVDFAKAPVDQIADAIRTLAEQIQFTKTHVERPAPRGRGTADGDEWSVQ